MTWKIRYFPTLEAVYAEFGESGPFPIGTMYPDPDYLDHIIEGKRIVSPEYLAQNAGRPPLALELPCGHFCVDTVTMKDGIPGDHGWQVVGDPGSITMHPSVDIKGGWHGFITDGVISDDVGGKTFPDRRPVHPGHIEGQ